MVLTLSLPETGFDLTYVVVTYLYKTLTFEHSNVSCQAALLCFALCFC